MTALISPQKEKKKKKSTCDKHNSISRNHFKIAGETITKKIFTNTIMQ